MKGGQAGEALIQEIDRHYLRIEGHPQPHGHEAEFARTAGGDVRHVAAAD